MHEHVNFFETTSLEALLLRVGVQLLGCEVSSQGHGLIALAGCRPISSRIDVFVLALNKVRAG